MGCTLKAPRCPASRQVRRNRHIEIVPLSTGCLGACTYCKTKHARGELGSYDPGALLERAAAAVADPQVLRCAVQCCACFSYCAVHAVLWFCCGPGGWCPARAGPG